MGERKKKDSGRDVKRGLGKMEENLSEEKGFEDGRAGGLPSARAVLTLRDRHT